MLGATAEQVIEIAKQYEEYEEYFYNGTEENGIIYFDLDSENTRMICDELSTHLKDAILFGFCSWDGNDFYASRNGSQFTGYNIRSDEAPFIDDPSILEDFEDEDYSEFQNTGIFCWNFTVLNREGSALFSVGAGDFALQEIDAIWNKR